MTVIGKNMISWFYAYVEHIAIKTKTVNIIHFPYLDLCQNPWCTLFIEESKEFRMQTGIYKSIFLIQVLREQLGDILFISIVIASGEAIMRA
jgi:hypothetical protein